MGHPFGLRLARVRSPHGVCLPSSSCPLGRRGDNGSHEPCPCLMVSFTRLRRRSRGRFRSSCGRSPSLPPPSSPASSLPLHKETMSSVCLTSPTQGENLIHIHIHTRGMDAMFSPLDFPEPLEEPRRREGRFSFFPPPRSFVSGPP